jgi:hypothetical protein
MKREVEGGDAGTEREGGESVAEIVDPAQRFDAGGKLRGLPRMARLPLRRLDRVSDRLVLDVTELPRDLQDLTARGLICVLRGVQLGARDRLAAAPLGGAIGELRAADAEDLSVGKQGKDGAAHEGIDPRAGRSPRAGSGRVDVARVAAPGEKHASVLQEHGVGFRNSVSPPVAGLVRNLRIQFLERRTGSKRTGE